MADERSIERDLMPYCLREGITIVAYSPSGRENLPGSFTMGGVEGQDT